MAIEYVCDGPACDHRGDHDSCITVSAEGAEHHFCGWGCLDRFMQRIFASRYADQESARVV